MNVFSAFLKKPTFLLLLPLLLFASCKKEKETVPVFRVSVDDLTDFAYWRMPFKSSREQTMNLRVNISQDTFFKERIKVVKLRVVNPHTGFDVSLGAASGDTSFSTQLKLLYKDAPTGTYPVQLQVLADTQVLQTLPFNCVIRKDTSCYEFFNNKTYRCVAAHTGNQVFEVQSRRPTATGNDLLLSGLPGMNGDIGIITYCENKTLGLYDSTFQHVAGIGNIWLAEDYTRDIEKTKLARVRLEFAIQLRNPNGTPSNRYLYTLYLNE